MIRYKKINWYKYSKLKQKAKKKKNSKEKKKTNSNQKKNFKICEMSLGGNDTYKNKLVKIFKAKTKS